MAHDITSPDFLRDPAPVLARMRAEGALVRVRLPILGTLWVTTTDQAARDLLKDTDLFVRDPGARGGKPLTARYWWLPGFLKPLLGNLLGVDGAAHARLRGLVDKAFARSRMEDLRGELDRIANDLLDRIDPARPADLIAAYARPLPLQAICVLLGIPPQDRARVARWISPISGPTGGWSMARALPGLWRLLRYFRAEFAAQRMRQQPGLIGDLVHVREGSDRLSDDELLTMVTVLFIAGHETTVHLIGNALAGLLAARDLRAHLAARPETLPLMVEEFMRHASPVMMTKPLYVTRDTVFHGQALKRDDAVAALLIGANRDPARRADPDTFQPERRPNAHLGFGHGPHVCLGMQLARTEAQVALTTLLSRFPQARLARDTPPPLSRRAGIRGFTRLDVVLSGAGPRA